MQKLESIQIMRAVAALLVVFFHAHGYVLPQKLHIGEPLFYGFSMGYAGVEIFFVISGFIMWHIHRLDVGRPARAWNFIYKRATRIYPIFLLIYVALIALYWLFPGHGPDSAQDLTQVLVSATLLPTPYSPVMVIAWTLQFEMFFYMIFTLLILSKMIGGTVIALWVVGCIINVFCNWQSFPASFLFSAYHFLFFMGAAGAELLRMRHLPRPFLMGLCGCLLFLTIGLLEAYSVVAWYKPLRTILYGISAFMMLAFVQSEKHDAQKGIVYRAFVVLGFASYSLYLLHSLIMTIAGELMEKEGIIFLLPTWVLFLIPPALAVLGSLIFYMLIEKRLQDFFKRMQLTKRLPLTTELENVENA